MPLHRPIQRPKRKPRRSARPTIRRVHPFLFFGTPDRGRDHEPYQARDLICLPHLQAALYQQGYQLGEVILNTPPQDGEAKDAVAPVAIRLGANDTLLIVTRIPINDDPTDKKRVLRGYTEHEPMVFEAASHYFWTLSRQKLLLREHLWAHARAGFENRVNITYYLQNGARLHQLRRAQYGRAEKPPAEPRGSAFLLNTELRRGGPRMIVVFGMDSHLTMVWSQIVARQHPEWLVQPGFTMVDLIRKRIPKRTTLLSFAQEWRYEIVMRVRE